MLNHFPVHKSPSENRGNRIRADIKDRSRGTLGSTSTARPGKYPSHRGVPENLARHATDVVCRATILNGTTHASFPRSGVSTFTSGDMTNQRSSLNGEGINRIAGQWRDEWIEPNADIRNSAALGTNLCRSCIAS